MGADIVKVMTPAIAAFTVGIAITPVITHYLYAYRVWKPKGGKTALDGTEAQEFNRLHGDRERNVPRMGGIVIWASVLLTIIGISLVATIFPQASTLKLSFLSRSQTWIPLFTLLIGASVGFVNDLYDVRGIKNALSVGRRLLLIAAMSLFIGWWFYTKLEINSIGIPFHAPLVIGAWIIPLFVFVTILVYASGVIDGIDGLSGGVFASVFASYATIAFFQHQIDLAAFAATCVGGILAFLWFNIPPARFFMTETGTMALTLTIAVLAFMTDTLGDGIGLAVLPIVGVLLMVTVASNVIQIVSKRVFGRKVFRIAPLHHHFEALGWPGYKVTMRYWILSIVAAFYGVILALIGTYRP